MKRFALAGTFALIGGAATLLMVASILYSCREGGTPHDMGNQSWAPEASERPVNVASAAYSDSPKSRCAVRLQVDLG